MEKGKNDLKADSIAKLSSYLDTLDSKRRDLLSYWIRDYVRFLQKEEIFDPHKLIRYKRGSIVKAHLGYRVGSEEGGLHYAVVLDVKNTQSDKTVTIIPLTSVKPTTDLENLPPARLYLGDELYQKLTAKLEKAVNEANTIKKSLLKDLDGLDLFLNTISQDSPDYDTQCAQARVKTDIIKQQLEVWKKKEYHSLKVQEELSQMKRGSIALISQITTISKIRIYDPLYPSDSLNKIRLSEESLNLIDEKVKKFFTKV